MTPLPVQDTVDSTNHLFWTLSDKNDYFKQLLGKTGPVKMKRPRTPYLDLHKVDRLHKPGLGGQHTGIEAATGSGDDLATPAVDGVRMQGHIMDIEAYTTHILLAQSPLQKEPRQTIKVLRLLQPLLPEQITQLYTNASSLHPGRPAASCPAQSTSLGTPSQKARHSPALPPRNQGQVTPSSPQQM